MQRHWPRIYRYLDRSAVQYRLATLSGESVLRALGNTSRRCATEVDIQFHPSLSHKGSDSSLLVGTLAHEGLHAILHAFSGQLHLPFAQARRLIESHWISRVPRPGYGEWLLDMHGKIGETAIELLANKLLVQHGLKPLVRGPNGEYDDTAD